MANQDEIHDETLSNRLGNWLDRMENSSTSGYLAVRHPTAISEPAGPESGALVFSGSFNPVHAGHLEMARIALTAYPGLTLCKELGNEPSTQIPDAVCWFEISVRNVDKTTVSATQLTRRLDQNFGAHGVIVTSAARFTEKAGLFFGATFIVGADTILRFADLKYHENDRGQLDNAIQWIADQHCRFLVFGRKTGNEFVDRRNIRLPERLFKLCSFIDSSQFARDISSSELRAKSDDHAPQTETPDED